MPDPRVAVFVDGDNVSPGYSPWVLQRAGKLGRVDVARVYADAAHFPAWSVKAGFRVIHAGSGKNATDILLCMDAVEVALLSTFESFVIATSDRDFTHLAQRLRERGSVVLGLGESKCHDAFRGACSRFELLPTDAEPSEFDRKIQCMIAQYSKNGSGMKISELSAKMHEVHETRISTYPQKSWHGYLSARRNLYDVDPRGPEAAVRFLASGFGLT